MAIVRKKTVLITGCSIGGIGWALAKNFHQRGYHVFATLRDPSKAGNLAELSDVQVMRLDVTDLQTIAQCKEAVETQTGGKLDILVNNAGIEVLSPLLDVDIDQVKHIFDVNVWGPLAVAQAFVPLVINARGVISNQSSIDAALSMVWAGVFSSSKAALARMSETLRNELEPVGVRVLTVMCGSADTPMFGKAGGRLDLPENSYYHNAVDAAYKERMDHQTKAMEVGVLAEKLAGAIINGSHGAIWYGAMSSLVRLITWILPTSLVDSLVNAERGIKLIKRS